MKTLHKTTILFLVACLFSSFSFSQIIVANKLKKPNIEFSKKKFSRTQIWVTGEWIVSGNQYIWEKGYWTDKRPGFVFIPGYWKKVKGGWTWILGEWKSTSMKKWNTMNA